jgi:hypothetical protein
MRFPTLLAMVLATAMALPAAARVRITCEDGGGAVGRGNGRRFDAASMCDVDRTCDGVCTFAIPGDCVSAELRLAFYTPTGYEVVCDPDELQAPCRSQVPIFVLMTPEEGVAHERRRFLYKNDRFFEADLVCKANRSCTPPPETAPATDLTGNWIIVESMVTDDCPPDSPYLRSLSFLPPHSLLIEQQGDALRACAAGVQFFGPGSVTTDGFRIGAAEPSQGFRRQLSGTLDGLPDKAAVTDVVSVYGSSSEPVCTRTTTGILARTDPACSGPGRCLGQGPCSRCVRGRCRPMADCRYSFGFRP